MLVYCYRCYSRSSSDGGDGGSSGSGSSSSGSSSLGAVFFLSVHVMSFFFFLQMTCRDQVNTSQGTDEVDQTRLVFTLILQIVQSLRSL